MELKVIGTGVGRTGTYSTKLALNELGFGPCHHMEEVIFNMLTQVPLWKDAAEGKPDWEAIYKGYNSTVDWPTAAFTRELSEAYPDAKFVHTMRSPESWVASFSETIYKLLSNIDEAPKEMQGWLKMVVSVTEKTGFPVGLDKTGLINAFNAHTETVKKAVPASNLLMFQVKDGWAPLCEFLGVPVPDSPFPRSNDRGEFWDKVSGKK
jgi:hypothetical protein